MIDINGVVHSWQAPTPSRDLVLCWPVPPNYRHARIAINRREYLVTGNTFIYHEAMNRMDHDGKFATSVRLMLTLIEQDGGTLSVAFEARYTQADMAYHLTFGG